MKAKWSMFVTMFYLTMNNMLWAEGEEMLPPPVDQSFWQTLVMIGIAFLFFYVILWRPEQKRKKALEDQRNALKKGDLVVAMGIIGTVVKINDQTIVLKMVDGTSKVKFYKAAITDILTESEDDKKNEIFLED